jgi:hypothetical protein
MPSSVLIYRTLRSLIFFCFLACLAETVSAQVLPLGNAHAHNDYKHKHPLADALHCGFTSIEADIFLKRNKLIVAHFSPFLKHKTLEDLYLKPLSDTVKINNGSVYPHRQQPVILLIDIKSNAGLCYAALLLQLEKYNSLLSYWENGFFHPGAITVIITGHKPYEIIKNEKRRIVFIDEGLLTIASNGNDSVLCPLSSAKYSSILSWNGKGKPDPEEYQRLVSLVNTAHQQGKRVRLWASPENENVWNMLLKAGVDLINTDELRKLQIFLLKKTPEKI